MNKTSKQYIDEFYTNEQDYYNDYINEIEDEEEEISTSNNKNKFDYNNVTYLSNTIQNNKNNKNNDCWDDNIECAEILF